MKLRPPSLEDAEAAAGVIAARQRADVGRAEITAQALRDEWGLSEIDLSADARVVEDRSGALIGYGLLRDEGAFGVVRPEAEGCGAGTLLLDWLEQRAQALGRPSHRQLTASTNRAAADLLSARGYRLAWSNHRMARVLSQPLPSPDPPGGVVIRGWQPEDTEAMHAVDNRAFADDPGYVPESLTTFREEHLEAHDAAPDLSLVAADGEEVIGFLVALRRDQGTVGYIDVLAVDPAHQGRGIGRALLLQAFNDFRAAGLEEAQLGVSSVNPRALNLYESAGMTPRFQQDIYERPTA